jgi:phosphoribosylformylglycinamidine synthase
VPYGKIVDTDVDSPTLTYNTLGAHQSKIVRVRVASNKSPWLRYNKVGDVYSIPLSCAEGRFVAPEEVIRHLGAVGQIATQYVDQKGNATADIRFNPTGSMMAVEGITSPDGRVIGRIGHVERTGSGLYRNVPGNHLFDMFESAVKYFK